MIEYIRCDGKNSDFVENCRLLDEDLERRVGKKIQREKYHQYNTLEKINEAIVVYMDGVLVGGAAIRKYDESTAELKRVFVHSNVQGFGIGTTLINNLMEWARELGYTKMILETGKLLQESVHIYQKIGFQIIDNYGPYVNMKESLCMGIDL